MIHQSVLALKLMHCCLILTNISFHMEISGSIYLIILDWRGFASDLSGRFHPVHEECSCPLIYDNEISVLEHSKYQMHVFDVCPFAHTWRKQKRLHSHTL